MAPSSRAELSRRRVTREKLGQRVLAGDWSKMKLRWEGALGTGTRLEYNARDVATISE